jgi:hypothetical protein
MKIAIALLCFAASAFAAGSPAEKEVAAVMDTWKQAMVKGDAKTLEKLYNKDITYEHSSAKTELKAEAIENATKPDGVLKALVIHDMTIRIFGNTALVKSKGEFTIHDGTVNHLDTLMVWVKFPQGWQLVARQSTKLP